MQYLRQCERFETYWKKTLKKACMRVVRVDYSKSWKAAKENLEKKPEQVSCYLLLQKVQCSFHSDV